MRISITSLLLTFLFLSVVLSDVFLHNPRGSINRNRESSTNRNNPNRLFDSQANGKGGYSAGPTMTYYEKSKLHLEWSSQANLYNGEFIFQYMCANHIRDGSSTDSPPFNSPDDPDTRDGNNEFYYGRHETLEYFTACTERPRNYGLFYADQTNPNANKSAVYTRQSNIPTTFGYECPEERDYYPYWHPSPWKDLLIVTSHPERCSYFESHSSDNFLCIGLSQIQNENNYYQYTIDLPPLDGSELNIDLEAQCVLRLRMNVSSDYQGYDTGEDFVDYLFNGDASPVTNDPVFELGNSLEIEKVQLDILTSHLGRTFEDRTHMFKIRGRDSTLEDKIIHNLNIIGKRGNPVQAYPAITYKFSPDILHASPGELIHFQWTGSDNYPGGIDGVGLDGTDRNNIVQTESRNSRYPMTFDKADLFPTLSLKRSFALLNQYSNTICINETSTNCCLSNEQLNSKWSNNNDKEDDPQNCFRLNGGTPYFDGGLIEMTEQKTYHYMSTRSATSRGVISGSIIVEDRTVQTIQDTSGTTTDHSMGSCLAPVSLFLLLSFVLLHY